MTLQEEIKAIIADAGLSYNEKREKLMKLMTPQEAKALLQKSSQLEVVELKEPLKPKKEDMRILRLSVFSEIFEDVLKGGHVECREYSEYFKSRCTYEEDGVRYLVPFDAITFYVGRGDRAKKATVLLKDITCDGEVILFYLGDVISRNNE
jgi:hypothetical protein